MTILLAFITGIVIGVLLSGTHDTFIYSFRKWLNESTEGDEKKRAEIEYNIEKTLPDFRKWVKEKIEEKRKRKRKFLLYCLVLLAIMLLFQSIQFSSDKNKQSSSVFQMNK
ncbi:MAG: DUF3899 domain-containing protein [Candidatus Electrothrix sp. AR1]|nr:DUF3899 domain-containing protein [Candidatus Electrothrix sp. AR1]